MEDDMQHFQHIMLYYFKKGENATETQKKICAVYGEGAVTDQTCQKWFSKFYAGDFLLDDAPRLGRQVEVDSDWSDINWEQSMLHHVGDRQHTQINKVIGENEKCVFYFTKKLNRLFVNLIYL